MRLEQMRWFFLRGWMGKPLSSTRFIPAALKGFAAKISSPDKLPFTFTCVLISTSLGADLCTGLYSWDRSLRLHKGEQHAVCLSLFIEGKLQFILQPGSCRLVFLQQTHSQTDSNRSVNTTEKVSRAPLQFVSVDPNYKPKTVHLVLCFYGWLYFYTFTPYQKQHLTN